MAPSEIKNRKAFHEYRVLETLEAGMVLQGTEVKSARLGNVQFADSYAREQDGELFLYNLNISPYKSGGYCNHKEDRPKKLLLKKREIRRLLVATAQKGNTLIPVKLYFKNSFLKCELGICTGKKTFDKREALKSQEARRQVERRMKDSR